MPVRHREIVLTLDREIAEAIRADPAMLDVFTRRVREVILRDMSDVPREDLEGVKVEVRFEVIYRSPPPRHPHH